jgi:hypothetical protein
MPDPDEIIDLLWDGLKFAIPFILLALSAIFCFGVFAGWLSTWLF